MTEIECYSLLKSLVKLPGTTIRDDKNRASFDLARMAFGIKRTNALWRDMSVFHSELAITDL